MLPSIRLGILTALGAAISFTLTAPVGAAVLDFDLSWTGQTLGYGAAGSFSYDSSVIPEDGIVRTDNLRTFDISFFTPEGDLIQSFVDNHLTTDGFNFNFDTATGEILQTGFWDSPTGISIGGVRGEELNFFSIPDPTSSLFADGIPSPHVHLTDWGSDFPDLPQGFTRGARPHLDIAFFTRTTAEVLDDPTLGEELGQRLVAVPEPSTWLGLGAIALILRQARAKAKVRM